MEMATRDVSPTSSQLVAVAQRLKRQRDDVREERDQLLVQLAAYEALLDTFFCHAGERPEGAE
jgi:hypothetical protein